MKCPRCGDPASKVIESRTVEEGVRRRRECSGCGDRFATFEQVQRAVVMVVKKDGRREAFQREKLRTSLAVAAQKRPLAAGAIDAVVDEIESRLLAADRPEVPSRVIGEMAITHLKRLDAIAYIRFASIYQQFLSLEEMLDHLASLAYGPTMPAPGQARLFGDELSELLEQRAERAPLVVEAPEDEPDAVPSRAPIPIGLLRTLATTVS